MIPDIMRDLADDELAIVVAGFVGLFGAQVLKEVSCGEVGGREYYIELREAGPDRGGFVMLWARLDGSHTDAAVYQAAKRRVQEVPEARLTVSDWARMVHASMGGAPARSAAPLPAIGEA